MAKNSVIARNEKRVQLEKKYREKRQELKATAQAAYAKGEIPWETLLELQKLPRNSAPGRVQHRCRICGRSKGVYRKFGLCRLCLRIFAMWGHIPGLMKSSW
jgi:small subunit ribosomal protein S14